MAIAARRAGFSPTIVRLTYVYGPGQAAHNAIPIFLGACWRGEQPVVFGDGHELRDDVLVTDVADGLAEVCLRRVEGILNAGGERARSLREVAALCCQAVAAAGGPAGPRPRGSTPAGRASPGSTRASTRPRCTRCSAARPTPMLSRAHRPGGGDARRGRMRTVIVTGATGHLGRYVVDELARAGFDVVAASRSGAVPRPPVRRRAPRSACGRWPLDVADDDAVAVLADALARPRRSSTSRAGTRPPPPPRRPPIGAG